MALQSSGPISLLDIQNEFGGTNPIGINEYYGADTGVPASGTISFDDFYGTSAGPSTLPPVSFGYYIGGRAGPTTSPNQIQRIQYSNDTLSIRPATLSLGRQSSTVVENTTYGYICGGYVRSSGTTTNRIDRFQFSNETSSNPPANLPTLVAGQRGISSSTKGFICGGVPQPSPPSVTGSNLIQEINLSNGTASNPSTVLGTPASSGGKLNDVSAGYVMVALATDPVTLEPSVNKLIYSNTTVSTIAATALPGNPSPQESFTNRSGGKGYIFGGFVASPAYASPSFYSTYIERLVYSTDTWGTTTARNNVNGRDNVGLFSDTAGYIAGAFIPSNSYAQYRDVWNKFAFSTETFITSTSSFGPTCYSGMSSTQI